MRSSTFPLALLLGFCSSFQLFHWSFLLLWEQFCRRVDAVTPVLMSQGASVFFFFPFSKWLSVFTVIFSVSMGQIPAIMLDFSCATGDILLLGTFEVFSKAGGI